MNNHISFGPVGFIGFQLIRNSERKMWWDERNEMTKNRRLMHKWQQENNYKFRKEIK